MTVTHVRHPDVREIYNDETLWVLSKSVGVLTHPNPPERRDDKALLRGVYNFRDQCYQLPGGGERRAYLVHRLDQETSGLLLASFDARIAEALRERWRERSVKKEYHALLLGTPKRPHGTWKDCLEKRTGARRAVVKVIRGEPNAETSYKVIEILHPAGLTLVSLQPKTGRTHQLRVQAAVRGVPIVGDALYGDFAANRQVREVCGSRRMFLHAASLTLLHPKTGERVSFQAPLDRTWKKAIRRFRDAKERFRHTRKDG